MMLPRPLLRRHAELDFLSVGCSSCTPLFVLSQKGVSGGLSLIFRSTLPRFLLRSFLEAFLSLCKTIFSFFPPLTSVRLGRVVRNFFLWWCGFMDEFPLYHVLESEAWRYVTCSDPFPLRLSVTFKTPRSSEDLLLGR